MSTEPLPKITEECLVELASVERQMVHEVMVVLERHGFPRDGLVVGATLIGWAAQAMVGAGAKDEFIKEHVVDTLKILRPLADLMTTMRASGVSQDEASKALEAAARAELRRLGAFEGPVAPSD